MLTKIGIALIALGVFNVLLALFSDCRHWLNYYLYKGKCTAKVHEVRPFTINDSRSAVERMEQDGVWQRLAQTEDRAVQLRPYGFLLFDQNKPMVRFEWRAGGNRYRGNYRYLRRHPRWNAGDVVELHYHPKKPWLYEVADPGIGADVARKVIASVLLFVVGVLSFGFGENGMARNDRAENRQLARQRIEEAIDSLPHVQLSAVSPEHGQDYEIVWEDPGMEAHIRALLGKEAGAVYHSDVWGIQVLRLNVTVKTEPGKFDSADSVLFDPAEESQALVHPYAGHQYPAVKNLRDLRHFDALQLLVSEMSLGSEPLSDLSGLESCVYLRSIRLSNLRPETLEPLSCLALLEELSLQNCGLVELSPLAGLSRLHTLHIYDTDVETLEPLSQLPELVYVTLSGVEVSSFEPLCRSTVSFLNLQQSMTDSGKNQNMDYSYLTHIPNLTYLNLQYHKAADLLLCQQIVAGNPKLRYLDISFTPAAKQSALIPDENLLALNDPLPGGLF